MDSEQQDNKQPINRREMFRRLGRGVWATGTAVTAVAATVRGHRIGQASTAEKLNWPTPDSTIEHVATAAAGVGCAAVIAGGMAGELTRREAALMIPGALGTAAFLHEAARRSALDPVRCAELSKENRRLPDWCVRVAGAKDEKKTQRRVSKN